MAIGASLFVLSRATGGPSLAQLAETSVPLDVALSNGKPSVVEFYADWCEVCKSLAGESSALRRRLGNDVNFVMLNVDNPTWAEEMAEYRVGGIPHFQYLDGQGRSRGSVVGNAPKEVLEANADALAGKAPTLPYARREAEATPIEANGISGGDETLPRSHG